MLGIIDVEQPDAVAPAAFSHRLHECGARGIGVIGAPRSGCDGMILHGEGKIRPPHAAVLFVQLLESVGRVQLVQNVAIDIDEVATIAALGHEVGIPDFVEEGLRH